MNCFKLIKMNYEDLDKINRKFLWILNVVPSEAKGILLITRGNDM